MSSIGLRVSSVFVLFVYLLFALIAMGKAKIWKK